MNELLNQISNFNIQHLTNSISIFEFGNIHKGWKDLITPAFISAITSGIVTLFINSINNNFQQRIVLHQKKYEFWLDFCKEYFSVEPFLSYMLNQAEVPWGILTTQSENEIKKVYKEWLQKWNHFYLKVLGNERIYLKKEKIDLLVINSFFTALGENINKLLITTENNGDSKISIIGKKSLSVIITRAKNLFEMNVKINSDLHVMYLDKINKFAQEQKINHDLNKNSSKEEVISTIKTMPDKVFIEFLRDNLEDTTRKLEKIVSTEPIINKIFRKINKVTKNKR